MQQVLWLVRTHGCLLYSKQVLLGYALLLGRVVGMGFERPLVKRLGQDRDPTATVVLYVGLGEVLFLMLWLAQLLHGGGGAGTLPAWLPLALAPGALNAVCFFAFIRAMRVGEVSLLTPLFATCFILMYAIDICAGFARLHWLPLCGVLLVTLGVVFLSPGGATPATSGGWRRYNPQLLLRQPGAGLMLLNAAAFAGTRFFDKTLAPDAEPLLYALVVNAPTVLIGLALLAHGTLRHAGSKLRCLAALARERWGTALWLTLFGQGAFVLLLYALDYFPPSVIEPVTQLGVFIAIALGGLWFGEQVRARWLPSAMVVLGACLLLLR